MKKTTLLVATLVAVVGCQAALSPTVVTTSAPPTAPETMIGGDLDKFALALGDLPKGFTVASSGPVSEEDYTKQFKDPDKVLAQAREWGRQSGYNQTFVSGPRIILVRLVTYKTPDGARAFYDNIETQLRDFGVVLEPVPAPKVGDGSKASTYQSMIQRGNTSVQATGYVVSFRKVNLIAAIINASTAGTVSLEETVNYANTIEAKIK